MNVRDVSERRAYGPWGVIAAGVAINALALALGPTANAKAVYAKSTKPPFAPPAWAFGIAWPANNALTIWGIWRALNAPPSADRTAYLRLQAATTALYATYGLVRFRWKSPLLGYANSSLYLALTIAAAVRARRIDPALLASFTTLLPWLVLATTLSAYELGDPDPLFDGRFGNGSAR